MAARESTLPEAGTEILKHLGAVGVTDALMKVLEKVPEQIAHSGVVPAAGSILAGLAGGPLAWGVVLIGGCLLHCRRSHCSAKQSEEVFRHLYRKLCEIEKATRDGQQMRGLLDELLGQNLALREQLARNEPLDGALRVAALETARELKLDLPQFERDVQVYLSNISDWIGEVQTGIVSLQTTQETALAEQRDADSQTHELLNKVLDRLNRQPAHSGTSPQAIVELVRASPAVRQAVEAALRRAEDEGAEGGPDALAAIAEIRARGDVTKLERFLEHERARREARIRADAAENAEICRELAAIALVRGDSIKARRLTEEILRFFPNDYLALLTLGDLFLIAGDSTGAGERFATVHNLLEARSRSNPADIVALHDLSLSHERIGDVLVAQGDGAAALESYRKGLAIRKRLAALDPRNTEWQRDLAVSYAQLGTLARGQHDEHEAKRRFEAGGSIMQRLVALDPTNAVWKRDLASFDNALS
jgi:tetratricopeptide (TPR) repeat protein